MHSPQARTFAQFGGLLLLVSLVLPYYALSLFGLGNHGFRLWSVDRGAFVLIAAFGLLAVAQVSFAARETIALIYMVLGGIFIAALIWRFWISPPGDLTFGGLKLPTGHLTGSGGQTTDLSLSGMLRSIGIEIKPSYGAWVGLAGSICFTIGAFLEFRTAGTTPAAPVETAGAIPGTPAATPQPTPGAVAPDPFAAGAGTPQRPEVPPDPFAPPPE